MSGYLKSKAFAVSPALHDAVELVRPLQDRRLSSAADPLPTPFRHAEIPLSASAAISGSTD